MTIKVKKETIQEIEIEPISFWKMSGLFYRITSSGLFVIGENFISMQSNEGYYMREINPDEIERIIQKGTIISKEDFDFQLNKTILNLKNYYKNEN